MQSINPKYKLAIFDSHPVQYRAPLFKKIAQHPDIDLFVYYFSHLGIEKTLDPEFNTVFKWDIPLLDGYRYKFLKALIAFLPPWLLFNPALFWELKRERIDTVLIYGYNLLNNWVLALLAPLLGIKVIFTGETIIETKRKHSGIFSAFKKFCLSLFFSKVKAFLYIGTKSREFYENYRIPSNHMFFTPYCVDNDFFISHIEKYRGLKDKIKEEMGIPKGLPVILCVAKMTSRKRHRDLLFAFEKIDKKAALVLVGEGKLRPPLEDYIYENQIKNVFFVGFKNQTELPRYYAIADIFVLPSEYEPWGLVINEAMCAGLPVVTTDKVAAAYDLVKEAENGYMLKVADTQGLAKSLEELISDENRRKEMGLRSLEIISSWNYPVCVKGVIEALK